MKRVKRVQRSKTWYGAVGVALHSGSRAMDSQIARLIVLHEDLKIEAVGAVRKKTLLDYAGVDYRRFYFVRASLQTFREANTVLSALNKDPDFRRRVIHRMSDEEKRRWKEAVSFFKKNSPLMNAARNVVGGHFSKKAGECAIANLDRGTSAKIEIKVHKSRKGAGITFHFAGDIVAVAMTAKRATKSEADYVNELFTVMKDAYMHLTNATHTLAICYLLPRIEGR